MDIDLPADLIAALRARPRTLVLTGAGVSAESGLPTFREAQTGLWAQYRPEDLATPAAFQRDPRLVWEWYAWRRGLVQLARPNPGHLALAQLADLLPGFSLITQNVDGLHQQAGSQAVIELHGSIQRARCEKEGTVFHSWEESDEIPPRCPDCGAFLRPDVVWFGESLPALALQGAFEAARTCQLFLSVGTSGLVEPAASLAYAALESGAQVLEINPQPTPLSPSATWVIQASASLALPAIVQAVTG